MLVRHKNASMKTSLCTSASIGSKFDMKNHARFPHFNGRCVSVVRGVATWLLSNDVACYGNHVRSFSGMEHTILKAVTKKSTL